MNPENPFEKRPWGEFHVLLNKDHFKAKWIIVNPGGQLSYQSHQHREEHWVLVRGEGVMIIDDESKNVRAGDYIRIGLGAKHRIKNNGTSALEFIEVQLGTYFGEDDITRYQDDYRRT
jgi:mannose-6-phosphate isomerase-like protein (cupin superfamily)